MHLPTNRSSHDTRNRNPFGAGADGSVGRSEGEAPAKLRAVPFLSSRAQLKRVRLTVFLKQAQSYCPLDIRHSSGAHLLKTVDSGRLCGTLTMKEPVDAELLKDLRGLGKPPSFDGNDSECQDCRFSFRIHMSLVNPVSHTLMDKCVIEPDPISMKAVKALGDAPALITNGSVRTLVRAIEESNGAEK